MIENTTFKIHTIATIFLSIKNVRYIVIEIA